MSVCVHKIVLVKHMTTVYVSFQQSRRNPGQFYHGISLLHDASFSVIVEAIVNQLYCRWCRYASILWGLGERQVLWPHCALLGSGDMSRTWTISRLRVPQIRGTSARQLLEEVVNFRAPCCSICEVAGSRIGAQHVET
jgi:hypothetical protein